jgi:uncharacterized protein YcaQ
LNPKSNIPLISLEQARALALASQGLLGNSFGSGKAGALKTLEHTGYIQIDTLSVAARAHHHTLWTRVSAYDEKHLDQLLEKDRSIFEYWSHAASYLPMKDYRYSLPRKKDYVRGRSHWFEQDKKMQKYVLDRIKAEGALQSKDFEFKRNGPGNWYEWKPAKRALEQLFMEGKLMVTKRQAFQKVYDLAERVLPSNVDTTMPSEKEYAEYLVMRAIQANGIVEEKEVSYLRKGLREPVAKAVRKLLKEGRIAEIRIPGDDKASLFVDPERISHPIVPADPVLHILSPFDNLIIQRKRVQRLFNFDYVIECYLPEPKRKFGYFCLPVLYGDKFVGRFDPKADRAEKVFYVKQMHFEKHFKPDEQFNRMFVSKLKEYAAFTGCGKIKTGTAEKNWKKEIASLLK